jgi:dGTPase
MLPDGFEGNAQTLRIVTKLTVRDLKRHQTEMNHPPVRDYRRGLDLTRGTLRALLKYPWLRGDHTEYPRKWSVYDCDLDVLLWSTDTDREAYRLQVESQHLERSLEARIMDWADDITYAVHDIDDFYRLALVPLNELAREGTVRTDFFDYAMETIDFRYEPGDEKAALRSFAEGWFAMFPPRRFSNLPNDTAKINGLVSDLINEFITNTSIVDNRLSIPSNIRFLNVVLKQLTWYYVIDNPALATIQAGQQQMLRSLFSHLRELTTAHYIENSSASRKVKSNRRIPPMLRYYVDYTMTGDHGCQLAYASPEQRMTRGILDFMASLTDGAVQRLYARLTGEPGISIMEPAIAM